MSQRGGQAVYVISVAAGLCHSHPQTLRSYERLGLLAPARTPGGVRLYSDEDIVTLRRIVELSAQGINLAGISRILTLEKENLALTVALHAARQPSHPDRGTGQTDTSPTGTGRGARTRR